MLLGALIAQLVAHAATVMPPAWGQIQLATAPGAVAAALSDLIFAQIDGNALRAEQDSEGDD